MAEFVKRDRIPFAHVRNIKFLPSGKKDFYEAPHMSEYGSLDMYKIMKAMYDNGFDGYIRPDHGRMIWGETGRPGYGYGLSTTLHIQSKSSRFFTTRGSPNIG